MKTTILALILCLACLQLSATVYFNNVAGDDARSGLSPEESVKTLAKAVAVLRGQKEKVLVIENTGQTYYESLRLTNFETSPENPLIVEGNGAVISGLKELVKTKWQKQDDVYFYAAPRAGALNPYLVIDGKELPRRKGKNNLVPLSHYWNKDGVFFKPADGKTIADYRIFGTLLASGFVVVNTSYIICNDLVAEYFSNDGFNVHGDCQALVFNNIVGRYNGDDGFSVHEDVGSTVIGGNFYGNTYGIQDVNAARSSYYGIKVHGNRSIGIDFRGGSHAVIDAEVFGNNNNGIQVNFASNQAKHLGLKEDSAFLKPLIYMKRVKINNGTVGVSLKKNSSASISDSEISNCQTGILCDESSKLEVLRTKFKDCDKDIEDLSGTETVPE